jgi:hypothetical protein
MNAERTAEVRTGDARRPRPSLAEAWRANRKAGEVMQRRRRLVLSVSAASLLLLGSAGGRSGCGSAPPALPSTQCAPLHVTLEPGPVGSKLLPRAIIEDNPCPFEPDGSPTHGLWPTPSPCPVEISSVADCDWFDGDGFRALLPRREGLAPDGPLKIVGLDDLRYWFETRPGPKGPRSVLVLADVADALTLTAQAVEFRYRPGSNAAPRGTLFLTIPKPSNDVVTLAVMAPNAHVTLERGEVDLECEYAPLGCVFPVRKGTVLGTATPREGYELTRVLCGEVGRRGADGSRSLTLEVEGETTCTIDAEPIASRREIWLGTEGQGLLTSPSHPDCGAAGTCALETGSVIELQAQPAQGWKLARWRGDCADIAPGDDPPTDISLEVQASVDCTAVFAPRSADRVALDVSVDGRGQVTASGAGIDAQVIMTSANLLVPAGTAIQLVARSEEAFLGWAGSHPGCTGTSRRLELTIDGPATCAARFGAAPDPCAGLSTIPQPAISLVAVALDGTEVPVSGTDFALGLRLRATLSNLAAYPAGAEFVTRYRGQDHYGPVIVLDTMTETACVPFSLRVEASACGGLRAPPLDVHARAVPQSPCP